MVVLALFVVILLVFGISYKLSKDSQGFPSSYKGIKPGITTKEEVINKLGQPKRVLNNESKEFLIFDSVDKTLPNTLLVDKGKVKLVGEHIPSSRMLNLSDAMKKYGPPEKVMFNHYDFNTRTYIFASQGVAVIANVNYGTVYEISYFEPISIEAYLSSWGKELSETVERAD